MQRALHAPEQKAEPVSILIDGDNYDDMFEILDRALSLEGLRFSVTVDLRELEMAELSQAWPFVKDALVRCAPRIVPENHSLMVYAIMTGAVSSKEELKVRVTKYLRNKGVTCPLEVVTEW